VLKHRRNRRHQVRLSRAVVGNYEHALGVDRAVETEVREELFDQHSPHLRRDDERGHIAPSQILAIGLSEHLDAVDRLEGDQLVVLQFSHLSISKHGSSGNARDTGRRMITSSTGRS
jgi:hypothetical protein